MATGCWKIEKLIAYWKIAVEKNILVLVKFLRAPAWVTRENDNVRTTTSIDNF